MEVREGFRELFRRQLNACEWMYERVQKHVHEGIKSLHRRVHEHIQKGLNHVIEAFMNTSRKDKFS